MVYASKETRNAADRARYWRKKGLSMPDGNGGSSRSENLVPEFIPRAQRIHEFQQNGRAPTLARVESWLHNPTLTGVIVPLGVGVTIGFFGTVFASRYLGDLPKQARDLVGPYLPRKTLEAQAPRDPMSDLLDFG